MNPLWALLLVPVLFVVLGVVFAVIGVRTARAERRFRAVAQPTPGVVTGFRYRRYGEQDGAWAPVLRFRTATGVDVETEARTTLRRRYREGQQVTVRYDPQHPLAADVEGGGRGTGLLCGLFVVLGTAFAALGLLALVVVATVVTT